MLEQPRITAHITLLVGGNETRPHCPERANRIQMAEEDSPVPADLQGLHSDSPELSFSMQLDATERLSTHKSKPVPWILTGIQADEVPFGGISIMSGFFLFFPSTKARSNMAGFFKGSY